VNPYEAYRYEARGIELHKLTEPPVWSGRSGRYGRLRRCHGCRGHDAVGDIAATMQDCRIGDAESCRERRGRNPPITKLDMW